MKRYRAVVGSHLAAHADCDVDIGTESHPNRGKESIEQHSSVVGGLDGRGHFPGNLFAIPISTKKQSSVPESVSLSSLLLESQHILHEALMSSDQLQTGIPAPSYDRLLTRIVRIY